MTAGQVTRVVGSVGRSVALVGLLFIGNVQAQPLVNIETVTVGDPGNAADITGYGAVSNVFAIGKYEVTIGQYTTFLNSVASVTAESGDLRLWNTNMAANFSVGATVERSGSGTMESPYSYWVVGSGNRPIVFVSWFSAARFANWIQNGATNGASTENGAYTLNGATNGFAPARNADASWWIPTENEWYKAGYFRGGGADAGYWLYPTQSDALPVAEAHPPGAGNSANYYQVAEFNDAVIRPDGDKLTEVGAYASSPGPYGTFDQAGNVSEWTDTGLVWPGLRGGNWGSWPVTLESSFGPYYFDPSAEALYAVGFRLATVPEPSTYALLLITSAATLWHLRRRR